MSTYKIPKLPLPHNIESSQILKKAIKANKAIAELKGVAQAIPNQSLLINTLSLQESKDSSEIESIVTTHDELFRFEDKNKKQFSPASKEVHRYKKSLFYGIQQIQKRPITNNLLIEIVKIITERDSGFRNTPGTTLRNTQGEIVYTPPQDLNEIQESMKNLEEFINDPQVSDLDPLVKMAIIHHQFESIHPFFDGNGRSGRVLNILYLIQSEILDIPILYLSRYITQHKAEYYSLLQKVRIQNSWEEWILFILDALEETAQRAIKTIESIKVLMNEFKIIIKEQTKIYSHDLINNLFSHPYTKIDYLVTESKISRVTASKYLNELVSIGLLETKKVGTSRYYINTKLLKIFTDL